VLIHQIVAVIHWFVAALLALNALRLTLRPLVAKGPSPLGERVTSSIRWFLLSIPIFLLPAAILGGTGTLIWPE